jgi:hypothetical protein
MIQYLIALRVGPACETPAYIPERTGRRRSVTTDYAIPIPNRPVPIPLVSYPLESFVFDAVGASVRATDAERRLILTRNKEFAIQQVVVSEIEMRCPGASPNSDY